MRPISLLALLVILSASPVRADEVLLKNGDRSTGTAMSLAGRVLTFTTPYGKLQIPWPDVVRVAIRDPMLAALADLMALTRPQPPVIVDGGANAGIISTAGDTDVNNLRLDADIVARAGANRYAGSAAVTGADRGVETARNWTTAYKYDRFVSTRMFLNANAILTNDRFRDLDCGPRLVLPVLATDVDDPAGNAHRGWRPLVRQPEPRIAAGRQLCRAPRVSVVRRLCRARSHPVLPTCTTDTSA